MPGCRCDITITRDSTGAGHAIVDFAGSAPTHPGSFNAPAGVIRSAVMYVFRLMLNESLPLNEGLMRAIDLRIPAGMLNPAFVSDPSLCPPVAAGNVETSQRVVDALLKALGLAAGSQGTMNNLIFGNASSASAHDRFGYYETICGGSGAGPTFHGCHAVHTHMTNTRITDPEVLEQRYPVRLQRFAIRRGSGGRGLFNGGDGVVRELLFLEPVSLSLLTQHRVHPPYGMHAGGAGQPGEQHLILPDGTTETLAPVDSRDLSAGTALILQTPGGGGYGHIPKS